MAEAINRRTQLENELDALREELLLADEGYETAQSVAEREAADGNCQRIRRRIQSLREELRNLNADCSPQMKSRAKAHAASN